MSIELVAISGAGEAFISRDESNRLRFHKRYVPGAPLELGEDEADRVILVQGFARHHELFDSWAALEARTDELVPRVGIAAGGVPVSRRLAEAVLPRLEAQWQTDGFATPAIAGAVARLLESRSVSEDDNLRSRLTALLRPMTVSISYISKSGESEHARFDQMWEFFGASAQRAA